MGPHSFENPFYAFWSANESFLAGRYRAKRSAKVRLVPLVEHLKSLHLKARREGILSLEEDLDGIEHPLLREGVNAVLNGWDQDDTAFILQARAAQRPLKGAPLLEFLIIHLSISHLFLGTSPDIVDAQMRALFGDDADLLEPKPTVAETVVLNKKALEEILSHTKVPDTQKAADEFDTAVLAMDDIDVIRLLREIDNPTLVSALSGSDCTETWMKVLRNLSGSSANMLLDDARKMQPIPESVIVQARAKFIELDARLRGERYGK